MNFRLVFGVLVLCFVLLGTGLVAGVLIATDAYYLDTPLPVADYYVGQYDNGTCFVVNGSNWNNFLVGSANVVMDAVMSYGGHVVVGSGNFSLDYYVTVGSNVWLEGQGVSTRFYLAASRPELFANRTGFYGSSVSNVTFSDFLVDGTFLDSSLWNVTSRAGVYFDGNCSHITVRDLEVRNWRLYGVMFGVSGDCVMTDVNVLNCRFVRGGMWNPVYYLGYDGAIIGGLVMGNDIEDFSDLGVALGGTPSDGYVSGVIVSNNYIHDGDADGYGSGAGDDAVRGIRFEGDVRFCKAVDNVMWNLRTGLADMADGSDCEFSQNMIVANMSASAGSVVWICGERVKFIGNTVLAGYSDDNVALNIQGDCDNSVFLNNVVYDPSGSASSAGINLAAGATGNLLVGNRMDNFNVNYWDAGTDTRAHDNLTDGSWLAES